jgi:hypothetical protein
MKDEKGSMPVVLRHLRDAGGTRSLTARRREDGAVLIEGQDLGPGVGAAFGAGLNEYEWAWVIRPDAFPAAIEALGGHEGDDMLSLLVGWSCAHAGEDPGPCCKNAGVPIGFWNRIGASRSGSAASDVELLDWKASGQDAGELVDSRPIEGRRLGDQLAE